MKRFWVPGAVALAVLALLATGCQGGGGAPQTRLPPGLASNAPDIKMTDQHSHEVSLYSLKGAPALIAFIDTTCPGLCKLTTMKLRGVAEKLGASQGHKLRFVLITYNPILDGPKRLAAYAREMKLETPQWTLLTAPPARIDDILSRFGLSRVGDMEPAMLMDALDYIFLVREDGSVVRRYKGGTFATESMAADARAMLAGKLPPGSPSAARG